MTRLGRTGLCAVFLHARPSSIARGLPKTHWISARTAAWSRRAKGRRNSFLPQAPEARPLELQRTTRLELSRKRERGNQMGRVLIPAAKQPGASSRLAGSRQRQCLHLACIQELQMNALFVVIPQILPIRRNGAMYHGQIHWVECDPPLVEVL